MVNLGPDVMLQSVRAGNTEAPVAEEQVGRMLPGGRIPGHTAASLSRALGFGEPNGTRNLDPDELVDLLAQAGGSLSVVQMPVNLRDIVGTSDLENMVASPIPIEVTVELLADGELVSRTVSTEATILNAVSVPGYQVGDMHLHANSAGDDGNDTIQQICVDAHNKGMTFLTFTPHAQKLANSTSYSTYKALVDASAQPNGLVASTDLEMSTRFEYQVGAVSEPYSLVGTPITTWVGNADDGYYQTSMPFSFYFYGSARSTLYISTNGFVTFSSSGASSPTSVTIPNTNAPNAFIAPFWRDLNPGGGGAVYLYKDYDRVTVTWYKVPIKGTTYTQTFQCVLYPTGAIKFVYDTLTSPGAPAVGVEDDRGEYGARYSSSLYTGLRLDVSKVIGDSHYLAHNTGGYLPNPNPESRTGGDIIAAVDNTSTRYGSIAHPYASLYPWRYWTKASGSTQVPVTGFRGMELLSSESAASSSTLSQWDSRLVSGLQSTISGNGFVVGYSGSDLHFFSIGRWGDCLDYVYCSTQNMSSIHAAARAGKVVASSDGSMTTYEAVYGGTTYALGTVVPVASGGTVTLRGQVYLDTGATLTKLRLIRNGTYVCDLTGPSWSKTVSTTSDCYYRVELITSGGTSYTNPIFLNVP